MKNPLPSVREFVDAARRARHDSLGVAHDPEALIHVANVSRRAFLDDKDVMALRDWSTTVEDIANIDTVEAEVQYWLAVGGCVSWPLTVSWPTSLLRTFCHWWSD